MSKAQVKPYRGKLSRPETVKAVCRAIEAGATYKDAAQAAGIGQSSLYQWLADGEKPDAPRAKQNFFRLVSEAGARCRIAMTETIVNAAKDGDWRAALEFLKRRDRENWAETDPGRPPELARVVMIETVIPPLPAENEPEISELQGAEK